MVSSLKWTHLATTLLYLGFANAAQNVTIYASDTSVNYVGYGWKPYTGCGGTQFSYEVGSSFSVRFKGTAVYLYGTRGFAGGVLAINVDGYQSNIDRSATPEYICGETLYSRTDLPYGDHQLTVTFSGQSEGKTDGTGFIDWQWLQYTVPDDYELASSLPLDATNTYGSQTTSVANNVGSSKKKSNTGVIVGAALGGVAAVIGVALLVFFLWRRKRTNSNNSKEKIEIDGGVTSYTRTGSHGTHSTAPLVPPIGGIVVEYSNAPSRPATAATAGYPNSQRSPPSSAVQPPFPWMQSQGSTYSTSSSQRDSVGIDTSRSHLVPEAPVLPPPIHSNVYPIHHPTPSPAPSSLLSPSTMSSPSHGATQLPHQTISPPPLSDHDFNRITSRINAMKNGAGPSSSATPAPDYRFIETELLAQNQVDAANGRMDAPPSYDRKNL